MINPDLYREMSVLFDEVWYLALNPDVRSVGLDPLEHYIQYGDKEGRAPCRLFDAAWYLRQNPDVAGSDIPPLLHYLRHGAIELRNPHPAFDAAFYVDAYPESWGNPLLYHLLAGAARGLPTQRPFDIASCLPSTAAPAGAVDITVDVIIPVYRGLAETRRCIDSVLADPARPPGRILVIDDQSPEPKLSAWLDRLAARQRITLLRNARNLGFVGSVNRGMQAAGRNDVVLLNSDTEVPPGWLARLAAVAHSAPDIASVSPLSNNATICSYPRPNGGPMIGGGPIVIGDNLGAIDAACRAANAGRTVALPTTVGFCMYLRRDALDAVGPFDAKAFGRGYGEEVDFCRRAHALGKRSLLACDVFVFHQGEVSFGADNSHAARAKKILAKRYPSYEAEVARFVRLDPIGPARFALTASLFRASGLPGVLLVSHGLGGGVRRHLGELTARLAGIANVLLLEPSPAGITLNFPTIPGHPALSLGAGRATDLARYLAAANVQRVHVHHRLGVTMDLRALIRALGVRFDVTVHDYFDLCPQTNFLPFLDAQYCGEPEARHCNACLAASPAGGARDIHSWRHEHAWLFLEAARVICPSEDVRTRLARHGLAANAVVAAHEPVVTAPWKLTPPKLGPRTALRVAVLGVLADRKGLATVTAVTELADANVEFTLIGHTEQTPPADFAARVTITGAYDDADLPRLITEARPHVIWFPAQWPETYSYTLSAALDSGVPILASAIGAFPERLANRPLTWLIPPAAPPDVWLAALASARTALQGLTKPPANMPRPATADFYAADYPSVLRQLAPQMPARARPSRRKYATSVLLIPERLANGAISPCAHIRLLQPLDHPASGADIDLRVGDLASALDQTPDIIATHRYAIHSLADADALAAHCRDRGIRLIYDLDDDLLNLPDDHPEAHALRGRAEIVRRMLHHADTVFVSTAPLAGRLGRTKRVPSVVLNGLDERLFWPPPAATAPPVPARLLFMGTATHDADLALIAGVLTRLHDHFGARVGIDVIGVTSGALPRGVRRIEPPASASASYPAFMNWLSQEHRWHIGLAPLADTAFNQAKSAIKAMDYAALGLPCVASAVGPYSGTVRDGVTGLLVANMETAWFNALAGLLRDPRRCAQLAEGARAAFTTEFTLAAQAATRQAALLGKG